MTTKIDASVVAGMVQLEQAYFAAEINARMTALNVSQEFLAEYAGSFSQSELSKILGGTRPHDSVRASQIRKALRELEELAELFHPLQIEFKDAKKIREMVCSPLSFPNLFGAITAAIAATIAESEER